MMLLTLRGVPVLYMGDELALEDGAVPPERVHDVADPPRDPCRTPFPWTGAGAEWRNPWLPFPRPGGTSQTSAPTRARRCTSRAS